MSLADGTNVDPFTRTLAAIWQVLDASPSLAALVKLGNRIKYLQAGQADPRKPNSQDADKPQLDIRPSGGLFNTHFSSSSARAVQRYSVLLASAKLNVEAGFFPVKWALMRAFAQADANLGLPFVVSVNITDANEQIKGLDDDVEAWTALFSVTAEMNFPRSLMLAG